MNIGTAFPSKFLKVADLAGKEINVTIADCHVDAIGPEKQQRPVLSFIGVKKSLVLNQVNSRKIVMLLGSEETDNWQGKKICLVPSQTEYRGEVVPCIRIQAAKNAKAGKKPAGKPKPAVVEDPDDDLPPELIADAEERDIDPDDEDAVPF